MCLEITRAYIDFLLNLLFEVQEKEKIRILLLMNSHK